MEQLKLRLSAGHKNAIFTAGFKSNHPRTPVNRGSTRSIATAIALTWPLAAALLLSNRRRFYGALAGVVVSVALMQFQSSMVAGFLLSAKSPVRGLGAQIWLTPKHQPSFEFSSVLPRAYQTLLVGLEGVESAEPIVNGFTSLQTNSPETPVVRGSVALVGVRLARVNADLTGTRTAGRQINTKQLPNAIALDRIDRTLLGVRGGGGVDDGDTAVEVNGVQGVVTDFIDGYATFLGAPYAFVELNTARRMLGLAPEATSAVAIYTTPNMDDAAIAALARQIGARFPEVAVMTTAEYESRTALFWLIRTGAGGGLLLSAVLGVVIGFIIISQTLFALTMENLKEFATLRAMGIAPSRLMHVLLLQAAALATAGAVLGAAMGAAMVWGTRTFVLGRVMLPVWLPPAVFCVALLLAALASISSVRMLYRVQAADAFRQA